MPEKFADLFLDQRHDEFLPCIFDLNRLVMGMHSTTSPFAPVEVLGVIDAADPNRGHSPDKELSGDGFFVVLFDIGLAEVAVGIGAVKYIQLVPELAITLFDGCRGQDQYTPAQDSYPGKRLRLTASPG